VIAESCCLVTDIPPCTNYSGGIFIDHMLRALGGRIRAAFVLLNSKLLPDVSLLAASMQIETRVKPAERYFAYHSKEDIRALELKAQKRVAEEIFPQLLDFAKRFRIKSFWVLLEGQNMIRLAHELINHTDLPVFVQVMDPPRIWFTTHGVDEETERELFEQYGAVLRTARCCATASWAMAAEYTAEFGVPCVPVLPCLPGWLAKPRHTAPGGRQVFRVGIAGQLYALEEWKRLLRVLSSCDWTIGGCRMEVHAFTTHALSAEGLKEGHVIRRAWIPETHDLIDALSELDLLYMPYRFDEENRDEARLCFPSKLVTYFAAGRPVLVHGPDYSSPLRFVEEHDAGLCCADPSDGALLETLTAAVCDSERAEQAARNGRRVFDEYFTYRTLGSSLLRVLGTDSNSDE
jgi:hypothetical protein